jgi:non-ribosomal peptide synthetase component E (peptide arylation enzyme)
MAENGEVTVVRRYKDLIIRGGENISPSSIEQLLARDFSLTAEVVAAPGESIGARKALRLIFLRWNCGRRPSCCRERSFWG